MNKSGYEILAPVGKLEDMKDIIDAGADAVYVGLAGFSSRPRTSDLDIEEIRYGVEIAHQKQVSIYVAVNACINENQMDVLEQQLQELNQTKVDSVILADYGLIHFYAGMKNHRPIHASTLLGAYNCHTIDWLYTEDVKRIVLSTNLYLDEINDMIRFSPYSMEYEIVAEGGLCYNCNRGCRLPHMGEEDAYRVFCQERYGLNAGHWEQEVQQRIGHKAVHLGSTMGLYMALGICSYKIEGRTIAKHIIINKIRHMRQCRDYYLKFSSDLDCLPHYVCREWKRKNSIS